MEPKKPIYMVGHFDEYGCFSLYDWRSVCHDEETANCVLKQARTSTYVDGYEIYQVDPNSFKRIEEDKGLKDFTKLKALMNKVFDYSSFSWFNEELGFDCYIHGYWKYNSKTRTATYEFEYSLYNYRLYNASAEKRHDIEKQIEKDLESQCRYRLLPKIKELLKDNDLDVRVEFRNKYTRGKILRGFYTKES